MPVIIDRLSQLLKENDALYGVICRDATLTDIELMSQVGYHIIWIDIEHCPQSTEQAIQLARSITHLGMLPLVRIRELSRTNVQPLVDGGVRIIALPDVRSAEQAAELVELSKYPPLGQRGVSTTNAGVGFQLGSDLPETFRQANQATHLLVLFESDEGYESLDKILEVDGIDMVGVGANDWSASLGIYGEEAKKNLTPKIERVYNEAVKAGKIPIMGGGSPEQVQYFRKLGAKVYFTGVDVAMKRRMLVDTLKSFHDAHGS